MPGRITRDTTPNRPRDPFGCDEQAVIALLTAAAFVALADGRVDPSERDEAVEYIDRRQLAPTVSRQSLGDMFDERVRRLQDADFAELIVDGLRPVPSLSLTSEVIRIAEEVAAADDHVHPNEMQMITLIRLITMKLPEPTPVHSPRRSDRSR
jgi:tellurite resistance protein